ncbi:MAG: LamG domain-containing protein [Armatimonadetes bacterium]|nr:LamG domain-containing protein [Armatimonadota bacterium]
MCNKGDRSGDPPWPGWRLRFFWTRAVFQIGTPDGQEHAATSPEWDVMPGYWTHVAGTYDGQTLRVYTNGVLRAEIEAPGGVAPRKRSAVIGNYVGRKNAYPMDGLIDEVRIYNRALTVEEILAAACEGMLD